MTKPIYNFTLCVGVDEFAQSGCLWTNMQRNIQINTNEVDAKEMASGTENDLRAASTTFNLPVFPLSVLTYTSCVFLAHWITVLPHHYRVPIHQPTRPLSKMEPFTSCSLFCRTNWTQFLFLRFSGSIMLNWVILILIAAVKVTAHFSSDY